MSRWLISRSDESITQKGFSTSFSCGLAMKLPSMKLTIVVIISFITSRQSSYWTVISLLFWPEAQPASEPAERPHVEVGDQPNCVGDPADVEYLDGVVVVAVVLEEGLAGGVAEREVEVDAEEPAQRHQHQQLEDQEGRVGCQVVRQVREGVPVTPGQHHRPDWQDHQVLHEVEHELEQGDFLEVRPGQCAEGPQEPGSPGQVHPPREDAAVVPDFEQHQHQQQGHVTRVQHEEAALCAHLEVEGEAEAQQTHPEADPLSPILLQPADWRLFLPQMSAQGPDDEQGDSSGSKADNPDIVSGYLVVAGISSEVRDA